MFDLQVLAFQADITRVSTFMMARENIKRCVSRDRLAGSASLNVASRQQSRETRGIREDEPVSRPDAGLFLKRLDSIQDGDGTLLDHTAVLYGGGMSDGNVHNNYNVPVIVVGGKTIQLHGNRHVRYPKGTPLANLMLAMMDRFGVHIEKFGDSTSEIDLLTV